MGAQTDRLRCEVFQNLILSPINTGLLRYAVATVLTVYGIETKEISVKIENHLLQQYLPFTVLKLESTVRIPRHIYRLQQYLPFTVLKHHTSLQP